MNYKQERAERIRQTLFAIVGVAIVAITVVLDIQSQLKFTEGTRNHLYERASQQAVR